jgi:hypothetical protein
MDNAQFQAAMQAMQQQHAAMAQQNNAVLAALQQQLAAAQLAQQQPPLAAAAAAAAPPHRPKIPAASSYSGSATALDGWLREMQQQFDYYRMSADAEQVAMATAQLRGPALDWWSTSSEDSKTALAASFVQFSQALRTRFQPVNSAKLARRALDALVQGQRQSVHDYISAFRRLLVAVPDMSEADRVHAFARGLRGAVQTRLLELDPQTLDAAIEAAARIGSLGQYAASSSAGTGGNGNAMDLSVLGLDSHTQAESDVAANDGDPDAPVTRAEFRQLLAAMQHGRGGGVGKRPPFGRSDRSRGPPKVQGLTPEQVKQRLDQRLCFRCGQAGHRQTACPQNPAEKQGN